MHGDLSERRLTENEVIVRELNQRVVNGLTELKHLALTHDEADLAPDDTQPLHFYCECADIDCSKRILLSPKEYEKIHKNSRYFVIAKGHQFPEIESTIKHTPEYDIVEKNLEPSRVISQ